MNSTEQLVIVLLNISFALLISIVIFIVSKKIKIIPFPLLLFLAGITLSLINPTIFAEIKLNPSTVLYIYLPILLFESAYRFDFKEFRKILVPGFLLATVGLIISAGIIGSVLHYLFNIPLSESLLYAFVISSTDPIAVLSIFKSLGIPKRLQLLIDGESFLNDATSVVFFKIFSSALGLGVLAHNSQIVSETNLLFQFGQFVYLIIGGLVIGIILGWIFSEIISFIINIPVVESVLTIILALIVFIVAEHFFHVSGIIAVLSAGLVLGNYGRTKFSPSSQHAIHHTWEQLGFIVTSIVFLLIGIEIDFAFISQRLDLVIFSTLSLIAARFVSVFLTGFFYNVSVSKSKKIPYSWLHLANIGGVRGVLPLIVIFTLPLDFVYRDLFIQLSLAAILFTLIVNTLLIEPCIQILKLSKPSDIETIETKLTEIILIQSMLNKLHTFKKIGEVREDICNFHKTELLEKIEIIKSDVIKLINENTQINKKKEFENVLKRYFIHVERSVYQMFYKKQIIDVVLFEKLVSSLNKQIESIENEDIQFAENRTNIEDKLKKLKKVNVSIKSIAKRLVGVTEEESIQSIYLYYKARILGDEKVIHEMDTFFNKNIKLFSELKINHLKNTYLDLLAYNKEVIKTLQDKYPQITKEIEEFIYRRELCSFREELLQEFGEEDRISEKALSEIAG